MASTWELRATIGWSKVFENHPNSRILPIIQRPCFGKSQLLTGENFGKSKQKQKARKFEPKNIVIKMRLLNDFQTLWCRCRCYFLGTITDIFTSIETTQISLAVWIFFAHRPTLVHGKIGSAYCLSIGWWQLRTTIFLMLQNVWKSPKKSNSTHFTKLRSKQDKKMRIIVLFCLENGASYCFNNETFWVIFKHCDAALLDQCIALDFLKCPIQEIGQRLWQSPRNKDQNLERKMWLP